MLEEELVAEGFGDVVEFNDLVAQARSVGNIDFEVGLFFLGICGGQFLIGAQTRLLFGVTGLRGHPHPFQLPFQGLAALAFLLLFLRKARALLLQPGGIIPLPGNAFAAVEFQDPAGDVVQEITVVGDGDDRTLVMLQVGFQPLDALRVEVVGRFVEEQHVGLAEQQAA